MRPKSTETDLSTCEKPIMKVIWGWDKDIAVQELIVQMRVQFEKDYARTTVVTFLKKLSDKGYVKTYRVGNAAFVKPVITEENYQKMLVKKECNFWFDGKPSKMLSALLQSQDIPEEEMQTMRDMLVI